LFLQAALIGHGGFQTLGINSCIMVLPALLAWQLFTILQHVPGLKRRWFAIGLLTGLSAALVTVLLNCLVLAWGGIEDWWILAQGVLLLHLPLIPIEGTILGFTMSFLAQVKPEMLGLTLPEKRECPLESVR
jgi:cobalt/nickel transport system permease protein